jgi:ribosomal protein S27AE
MYSFKLFNEQNGGPNCNRCGRRTTLATVLPLLQCNVCNAVQWVAQKIAGDGG